MSFIVGIVGPRGSGKCLGRGTPVLLYDGSVKLVEAVRVGDLLMGPDSTPRRVLTTSVGIGQLYRILPTKGDPWVCNDEHMMTLTGTGTRDGFAGKVIDVSLNEYLKVHAGEAPGSQRWLLFRAAVTWPYRPVPFDPYFIGVWLGDGTRGEAHVTTARQEIIAALQGIADASGYELRSRREERNNTWNHRLVHPANSPADKSHANGLRRFLRSECERDRIKHVPRDYLVNDERTRLELLAGWLDTDGHLDHGGFELVARDAPLAEQALFLARSLGFAAYRAIKVVNGTPYHRITISGDLDRIPCRVAKKRAPPRRQIKRTTVTGWKAEPIGTGDYYGFTLDGDGRFLLGDFTVTHNTTLATAYALQAADQGRRLVGNYTLTGLPIHRLPKMPKRAKDEEEEEYLARVASVYGDMADSTVLIDEAPTLVESRRSGKDSILMWTYFFMQTRKRNVDVLFTAQMWDTVDKRLRGLTDFWLYCEDACGHVDARDGGCMGLSTVTVYAPRGEEMKPVERWLFDRNPIVPYFDSYELIMPGSV